MIESGMCGGVSQVVCSYAEANNKYMDNYDDNKESSFLQYLDENNLHGCPMTENFLVGGFKWVKSISKIDEKFIKNYDENSDIGFFLKVDFKYPEKLHDLYSNLPFLPEKTEINGHSKVACTLYDKKEYVAHISRKVCKAIAFFIKKRGLNHILKRIQN